MAGSAGGPAADGKAAVAAATSSATGMLWQSITERYDGAQRAEAATMTETNTDVVEDGGVQFVLRVAAKLREKPKAPPPAEGDGSQAKKEWRNPFLPYEQALWVCDLGASHVLLLNKFNIMPWHCLVVTADFQSQLDDLEAGDWAATWAVLQAMPEGGLAFYNCGPVSGASQPHKHVQIVPLPLDGSSGSSSSGSNGHSRDGSSLARPPIWPAIATATSAAPAGQLVELRNLPFAAFAATLAPPVHAQQAQQTQQAQQAQQAAAAAEVAAPQAAGAAAGAAGAAAGAAATAAAAEAAAAAGSVEAAAGEYLEGVYQQLMARFRSFVEAKTGRAGPSPRDGSLSYNMVCTRDFMMVVPRRQEADGPVSCNSVAFAGSIFVRSREEVQYVRERGPLSILTAAGFEW